LKPENLFLTHREDGTPRMKMLDFGISKVVSDAATGPGITRGIGTPLYMAPEQVLAQPVSAATDLYALALITYTLLVGVPYWQSDAERFDNSISFVIHTSRGVVEAASARAGLFGRTLPAGFDAWFARATSLNPKHRFQSAGEQVAALARVLGLELPAASITRLGDLSEREGASSSQRTQPLKTPGTAVDWTSAPPALSSRKTRTALIVAGAAAAVVAASGWFASRSHTTAPAPEQPTPERQASSGRSAAGSVLPSASSSATAVPAPASPSATTPRALLSVERAPQHPKPAVQTKVPKPAAAAPTSLYTRD
jgi:serine/threonine-protein kinase